MQRADPDHEARAVAAIARALRDIPFYVRRGAAPPSPDAALTAALRALPLLHKSDVRAVLPKAWVPSRRDLKAALASGDLEIVETSGFTGDRLRVLWERGAWRLQQARALRTNRRIAAALDGAAGPYREAVLTAPPRGLATCHAGDLPYEERVEGPRLTLNQRPDPTFWSDEEMQRMVAELARHATVGLEADPVFLGRLARFARASGQPLDVRGFVQLTHALTTRGVLRALNGLVRAPVYQVYAARHVGVLFVEGEDEILHHAPLTTHVELLPARVPTPGATGVALVVATTLDRDVQPLIRFVTGDLVQVDRAGPRVFTPVPPLRSVEGRVDDALLLPGGGLLTAGALDRALGEVPEVALFQANQRTRERVELDVVLEDGAPEKAALDAVRSRLAPLFGGLPLDVRRATAIAPEPGGKFRVSRRHFALDLAVSFQGCEDPRS